ANGVFFLIFALVWLLRHDGWRTFAFPWRAPEKFIPIVMAPLGAFLFFAFCFLKTGDAFAHTSTERLGWRWSFVTPWENLPAMLHGGGVVAFAALVSLAAALCSALLLRQRMYEEFAMCAALIVLIWCGQGVVSVFRYWLVLFPIWIAVARLIANRPPATAITFGLLAAINGLMTCAWSLGIPVSL
ncbi:MAG TPA: hypothetical protein VF132_01495, partial [Rudaea sp.]